MAELPAAIAELRRLRGELRDVIARHRIEVIQTHLLRALDFLVLTLRAEPGVRRVFWTFHNARLDLRPDQLAARRWLLRPKRILYRLLYGVAGRSVDGFIAVSEDVAASVLKNFRAPRRRVFTIPNGVDTERYGQPIDRAAVRRRVKVPVDAQVLIVVAKLMEQKGHAVLLRALPPLLERFADLHVLLVGDGPLRGALAESIAGQAGAARIHLAGNRRDVGDLLAASDLFVLPSLWEGLPMALLEAMASGLPVVATRVSGSAQVVVDGESGVLVPAGDAERLGEAIGALLDDPALARQLGRAARERVEGSYSARAQAARHAELYRRGPA
jgi:glycosyltransferase involved in cell wall biosynthesis